MIVDDLEELSKRFRMPGAPVLLSDHQAQTLSKLLLGLNVVSKHTVGRTRTMLLAPRAVEGCKTAVAIIGSAAARQLALFEYVENTHNLYLPSLITTFSEARLIIGAPVLHLVPASHLSAVGGARLLDELAPDLVIYDTSPSMRGTARGGRLYDYITRRKPRTLQWGE